MTAQPPPRLPRPLVFALCPLVGRYGLVTSAFCVGCDLLVLILLCVRLVNLILLVFLVKSINYFLASAVCTIPSDCLFSAEVLLLLYLVDLLLVQSCNKLELFIHTAVDLEQQQLCVRQLTLRRRGGGEVDRGKQPVSGRSTVQRYVPVESRLHYSFFSLQFGSDYADRLLYVFETINQNLCQDLSKSKTHFT